MSVMKTQLAKIRWEATLVLAMKDMQIVLEMVPTVMILTNAEEVYITVIRLLDV